MESAGVHSEDLRELHRCREIEADDDWTTPPSAEETAAMQRRAAEWQAAETTRLAAMFRQECTTCGVLLGYFAEPAPASECGRCAEAEEWCDGCGYRRINCKCKKEVTM